METYNYRTEEGARVRVHVKLQTSYSGDKPEWDVRVSICQKGKRTWVPVIDTNDYSYRRENDAERERMVLRATEPYNEFIVDALCSYHERITPTEMNMNIRP